MTKNKNAFQDWQVNILSEDLKLRVFFLRIE
jgi:hypothetical protein